jgi:phosphonate transport system substrate-binding protein
MAVTDIAGLEGLQREFGAFKAELERALAIAVDFFPVADRSAAAEALAANRVDMVFTGPAEYVIIRTRTKAVPIVGIKRKEYASTIYTRVDSGITSVAQLRGKTVAMSDVGSTSAHLGPAWLLHQAGVNPIRDVRILNVGTRAAHEALRRGDVQAVGVGFHHYERNMRTDDPARYLILVKGLSLPPDVVVVRHDLPPAFVDRLQKGFVQHWDRLLPAMLKGEDNQKYLNAELVVVKDEDFDLVRAMYRVIGVTRFDRFVGN